MHVMMTDWDDLKTVMMLVRYQTLAGAADALGVNYTTVARRIKRAETALGVQLFERLADGYRPTSAALTAVKHAERMDASAHDLHRSVLGEQDNLVGPLTITAPQLMIAHFLAPVLDEFERTYPQIDLRVLATNDILDLTRLEADLAIRISGSPGDTLKGLRLLRQQTASFASPLIARQIAEHPKAMIPWIIHDSAKAVPKAIDRKYPNNRIRFQFDDMVAMLGAAEAGLGVVRAPLILGRAIAGLEQVPVLPPQPYADIWVVGHPDVWPSKKLQAFRDILVPYCKAHANAFVGT